MKNLVLSIIVTFLAGLILALSLRGNLGNPTITELQSEYWRDEGPLELSPERGRFGLLYSIIEDNSFHFSLPVAKFIVPDLGYKDGKYVSLFAPGVTFLVIPGYILGKIFGASQVGTYAVVGLFAILNFLLIKEIAKRLGASSLASIISGLIFLFGSPAFAYAVNLYQHHISTFLLLLSIYLLMRFKSLWAVAGVFFLAAFSISVDYPNFFMMIPIGIYCLARFFKVGIANRRVFLSFKTLSVLTFFGGVLPLAFFLWFNNVSYGSPFQLSGTLRAVKEIGEDGQPLDPSKIGKDAKLGEDDLDTSSRNAVGFFNTRFLVNGFYTHFFSPDRGILMYTPVILFGVIGFIILYDKRNKASLLLISVLGMNVVLYSMWGDPYGGWAFGSRYLIPTYAILAIFAAMFLTEYRRNIILMVFFFLVASYSISVNTLGALTSSRNPPKVEVLYLEEISGVIQKYTPERNLDYLNSGKSKSVFFRSFASNFMNAVQYYTIVNLAIIFTLGTLLVLFYSKFGEEKTK